MEGFPGPGDRGPPRDGGGDGPVPGRPQTPSMWEELFGLPAGSLGPGPAPRREAPPPPARPAAQPARTVRRAVSPAAAPGAAPPPAGPSGDAPRRAPPGGDGGSGAVRAPAAAPAREARAAASGRGLGMAWRGNPALLREALIAAETLGPCLALRGPR